MTQLAGEVCDPFRSPRCLEGQQPDTHFKHIAETARTDPDLIKNSGALASAAQRTRPGSVVEGIGEHDLHADSVSRFGDSRTATKSIVTGVLNAR